MSVRPILTWPDARLEAVCAPVEAITPEVRALAEDMLETMYAAPGRGLAAPQVGELVRLFVMDVTWKEGARSPVVCINPDAIERGVEVASADEGCLSIPGVTAHVTRPTSVRMVWTDLDGVVHDEWLTGFAALCAQHELDHLDGVVTLDRVDDAQRDAILAVYEGDQ
ncbi:peptide deformylase [Tateyamaria sp. ANG-S1]|uniref:peptide deformylase n=1 Tax=Tateyamaria sp. ANG-S1 TaxID=1577905 RepID=UPI00057DDA0F|nr:peptide deformylase [Tateyamaria sp. ANG-S1]KIC51979.1 N-formylmethionyl-tRNA deformylase [Tateyamaria sp. ANG-S1]